MLNNSCSYGTTCKFRHVDEGEVVGDADGRDQEGGASEKIICQMYSRTRTCKYGDACIYKHICTITSTPSQQSMTKPKLKISKIQEKQKKRKARMTESNIHEARVLKMGRGDAPIREKKMKKDKNLSLDEQAYKQIKKTKNEAESSFHCFRCNIKKKSTIKYEWNTSEGVKVLCNGCNGNLTAMTKTL